MISDVRRHAIRILLFLNILLLCLGSPALQAQTADTAYTSLLPGPKPLPCSNHCEQLVGIYGLKPSIIVLERDGKLHYRDTEGIEHPLRQVKGMFEATLTDSSKIEIRLPMNADFGPISFLGIGGKTYRRIDGEGGAFFHITPAKRLSELGASAAAAKPPVEAGPFRKPDLLELVKLDPAIHLDIRYAQANNFLSTPIYTQARAFLQRPAAEALLRVAHKLLPLGYGLLIHDAYRPWYVTKMFWDATPPEDHNFVADPRLGSRHNRGCAVDLTLYDLATGVPVEMPGLYDEMSPRSFPNFPGGTSLQRWHRDLLRRAMESEGFRVNDDEWWHFDYKDWKQYGILNIRFEALAAQASQ